MKKELCKLLLIVLALGGFLAVVPSAWATNIGGQGCEKPDDGGDDDDGSLGDEGGDGGSLGDGGGSSGSLGGSDDDSLGDDDDDCSSDPEPGSFHFVQSFGRLPFDSFFGSSSIEILKIEPTPSLAGPQALFYNSHTDVQVLRIDRYNSGNVKTVLISRKDSEAYQYNFSDGAAVGYTGGSNLVQSISSVCLLDDLGNEEAAAPTQIKQVFDNGSHIVFGVDTKKPISFTSARGRTLNVEDLDLDVIKEGNILRQILAPEGLADIVTLTDSSYSIDFYTSEQVGALNTEGLYDTTGTAYRSILFEDVDPASKRYDAIRVTYTRGDKVQVHNWTYESTASAWTLNKDDLHKETKSIFQIDTTTEVAERIVRDGNDNVVSETQEFSTDFAWGSRKTVIVKDPDGIAHRKEWTYYEDASLTGSYGKTATRKDFDGSWTRYEYDSSGRLSKKVRSWLDQPIDAAESLARVTTYDYTPLSADDVPLFFDARARTITTSIEGIVTYKVFRHYSYDSNNRFVSVRELATSQSASYGDASNLQSSWIYYASDDADPVLRGRLYQELMPNGTAKEYTYAYDLDGNFVETVTLLAHDGQGTLTPVTGKSTQMVKTSSPQGELLAEETFVYDGSSYQSIELIENTYDEEMQLLTRSRNGREVLTNTWIDGEKVAMLDEQGVLTEYTYDLLDRVETETRAAVPASGSYPAQEAITKFYTRDLGEIDCGCDGKVSVTIQAGALSLSNTTDTDKLSRTTQITDPSGYITTMAYTNEGRLVTTTNPDGSTRIVEKYLDGRTKSITGTGVIAEYYAYGVNSDGTQFTTMTTGTSGSSRTMTSTFDLAERLILEEKPGFDGSTLTTTYSYNDENLLSKENTPEQADTLYEYDSLAKLIRSGLDINANGQLDLASSDRITDNDTLHQNIAGDWFAVSTTAIYASDNDGTATQVSESRRRLTNFATGSNGILASEDTSIDIHGNQTVSQLWIDRPAKLSTRIVDTVTSSIDSEEIAYNGRISASINSFGHTTTFQYDPLGRQNGVLDPRTGLSITAYQLGTNLVSSQSDAAGNTTSFTYYATGEQGAPNSKQVTNADGKNIYFAYDLLGRQIQTWGQADYPTEMAYNDFGELVSLKTYRNGNFTGASFPIGAIADETTWIYQESTGLLTRKQYADSNGTDYTYTPAGKLETRTWARGIITTYGYDSSTGELLTVDYSDGTPDITYAYDRLGRQDTINDVLGTRSFAYNPTTLQLASETFPDGKILNRSYQVGGSNSVAGRNAGYDLTDAGLISLAAATYTYHSDGRLHTVSDSIDSFSYAYETESMLLSSMSSPVHTTNYSYETNRDLLTQVQNGIYSTYTYTNDNLGRRATRTQSGSAFTQSSTDTFTYNDRSEVIGSTNDQQSVLDFNYSFDNIGNRLNFTQAAVPTNYTANSLNQYTSVSGFPVSPTYDDDGNTTLKGDGWEYSWNGENRLVEAKNLLEDQRLTFAYDYQGRRVKKTVFDGYSSSIVLEDLQFVYEGWNLIHEDNSSSSKVYLWGMDLSGTMQGAGGVGGLLKSSDGYFTYDVNGNVSEVIDNIGVVVSHYEYSPFGKVLVASGVGVDDNRFRFSTKYEDRESGLNYYGFRYYDAGLGRWLNKDPVQEEGGFNLYAFVFNASLNHLDILGQLAPLAWVVIYAAGRFVVKQAAKGIAKRLAQKKARECTALAAAVQAAKKPAQKFGKCRSTDSCSTLTAKKAAWLALVAARNRLHKKCFGGGNAGHQQQVADHYKTIADCGAEFSKRCLCPPPLT